MTTNPCQHHDTIAGGVLAALVGLASLGALLNATGHPALTGLIVAGLALLVGTGRGIALRLRERREDAADALTGAAWRAHHMPHLVAQPERSNSKHHGQRAGVA